MKAPDNYIKFKDIEEQIQKYKEWGFGSCKNGILTDLKYKGSFTKYDSESCEIVGCTDFLPDESVIVIKLLLSDKLIPIERHFLKQMQSKKFSLSDSE